MKTLFRKTVLLLCLTAFSLCLVACGTGVVPAPEPAAPQAPAGSEPQLICFTDDLGRTICTAPPRRVAALIGSFADIWCLAGGKDQLVAAASDTWTSFDLALSDQVVDLGPVKTPSLEKLLAVRPDLVLASTNTAADLELLETLEKAGLCAAYFNVEHFDDYLRMLEICTSLTDCPENYIRYGTDVSAQVAAAVARADGTHPSVLTMRAAGSSIKVKGSVGFLLGEMLADLGCVNIADSDDSLLEELSLEAILKADPAYIFIVLQGSDPSKAMELLESTLLSEPAWQQLSAVREGRFFLLEHELFNLKPNDRWGEAYEKLTDILFPGT